jgi:hypothetical protein
MKVVLSLARDVSVIKFSPESEGALYCQRDFITIFQQTADSRLRRTKIGVSLGIHYPDFVSKDHTETTTTALLVTAKGEGAFLTIDGARHSRGHTQIQIEPTRYLALALLGVYVLVLLLHTEHNIEFDRIVPAHRPVIGRIQLISAG